MKPPLCVRPLTDAERNAVETGLRAPNAFTRRRRQLRSASARGAQVPRIAASLSGHEQTVRHASHAFAATGGAALTTRSCAVHTAQAACPPDAAAARRALLHRRPRDCGHQTRRWTRARAAAAAHQQGLPATRVTGETIRARLARLGVRWRRATTGLTSPAPASARNNGGATG